MNWASTKAYKELIESGDASAKRATVYAIIKKHPGITRRQVSELAKDMELQGVCGRVNELMNSHRVMQKGYVRDIATGKTVNRLYAV